MNGRSIRCGSGSIASCTPSSGSSGCSSSRAGSGSPLPAFSARRRRKASRSRYPQRSAKPSEGRPARYLIRHFRNRVGQSLAGGLDRRQTMEASMLSPDSVCDPESLSRTAADYAVVRRAIAFVAERWRAQPEIDAIAAAAGVSANELHHLFRRWAAITPKAFLQALTLEHARRLLRDSASVLEAAFEVGLSGPGRLHDLFVTHEAMSPGEWKSGGAGLTVSYGFHPSPFGTALVMATERGLAGLAFADAGEEQMALADMRGRWPQASVIEDADRTAPLVRRVFEPKLWRAEAPLRVVLIGTDFEVRVWETLLTIPMGRAMSYSDIAAKIQAPKAARAVGAAVGKNPLSFVVPCHRALGKNGDLTGYHWGLTRKRAMIGWEAGQVGAS